MIIKIDFPIPQEKAVFRKCENCIFKAIFRSCCSLYPNLADAIKHYQENKETGCFMFTCKDEVVLWKVGEFYEKDS